MPLLYNIDGFYPIKALKMQKTKFRKKCIEDLKSWFTLSIAQRDKQNKQVTKQIKTIITQTKAKNILFYMPFGFEINVLKLIKSLKKTRKYNIFIPHIIGDTFAPSVYRLPTKKEPRLKMIESNLSSFCATNTKLDICIVPILGFDSTFRRVGFGLGMYDRFGANALKGYSKRRAKIIFVQNKICFSKCVVTNDYDIRGDYIISPKGVIVNTKK